MLLADAYKTVTLHLMDVLRSHHQSTSIQALKFAVLTGYHGWKIVIALLGVIITIQMVGLQISQEKNASRIVILQLDTLALHTIIMEPKSIQPQMNVASVLTGLIVTCVQQTLLVIHYP